MSVEIGEKIFMKRNELGLSQEGLASMVDMSQSHLSALEKGAPIKWSEIEKLAKACKTPTAKLLPDSTMIEYHNTFNDTSNQVNYNAPVSVNMPLETIIKIIKDALK